MLTSIPQEDYLRVIAEAELVAIPVNNRETVGADMVTVENSTTVDFSAPIEAATPVVLYLKKAGA